MSIENLRSIINHFGAALIAYALDTEEVTVVRIAEEVEEAETLGPEKLKLLGQILQRLEEERVSSAVAGLPIQMSLMHLVEGAGPRKRSLFNMWRVVAGGALPDFGAEDEVMNAFAPIALEMYPLCIAAKMTGPFGMAYITPTFFDDSGSPAFEDAVLGDPLLCRFFAIEEKNGHQVQVNVKTNAGNSGPVLMSEFENSILHASYVYARMKSGLHPDGFKQALRHTFSVLRAAAEGKRVSIPIWIGFVNIAVPRKLQLPWGTIHPYPDVNSLEFVPGEARPAVSGAENTALGFVLETDYQYQVEFDYGYLEKKSDAIEWPASMKEQEVALQRACEHTQLSFTLAVDRNPPLGCSRAWSLTSDPLVTLGLSWYMRPPTPVQHHTVSDEESVCVEKWARLLQVTPHTRVDIGQRRLIAAVTERRNPVDGFVDAIIVWENLFAGTDQGELSFRICGAISKLLEIHAEKRFKLHKELKDLYAARSQVVHGAKELTVEEAIVSRNRALEIAMRALRVLYDEHPKLLSDPNRSRHILLALK